VRSASRRRHGLLALEQINYALIIVLGGAILLLLVGTQILDWYWLALLAALGLAIGVFRFRRRRQPPYQIAQILDSRLGLSDTLSTAWFVLTTPASPNAPRQLQLSRAETVASGIQPKTVFPRQALRSWAPNALLFLTACTLFSVRYFSYDQLNFRQTLLPVHFGNSAKTSEAKLQTDAQRKRESALGKPDLPPAISTSPLQQNSDDASGLPTPSDKSEAAQEAIDSRGARQPNGQPNPNASPNQHDQQTSAREMQATNSSPNESLSTSRTSSHSPPPSTNPSSHQAQQQSSKESSAEEKSLTSKLRDVLSDLLAKMREGSAQQRGDAGGNQAHNSNRDSQSTGTKQNQQSTSEANDSKESQASSLQSQQSQQQASTASNSPSKGSGNASGHQSSDSRSAAGRQDGAKGIKEAEELKAMGKLEEIIGKRSASLKGEMTIDSAAGTQQLRTGYTNKTGQHSGIGSEMDHEQIPMEDQQYVREYMKQVHNQPQTP